VKARSERHKRSWVERYSASITAADSLLTELGKVPPLWPVGAASTEGERGIVSLTYFSECSIGKIFILIVQGQKLPVSLTRNQKFLENQGPKGLFGGFLTSQRAS